MLIIILVPATLVVIAIMLGKVAELERQEVEFEEQRKAEAATSTLGRVTRQGAPLSGSPTVAIPQYSDSAAPGTVPGGRWRR